MHTLGVTRAPAGREEGRRRDCGTHACRRAGWQVPMAVLHAPQADRCEAGGGERETRTGARARAIRLRSAYLQSVLARDTGLQVLLLDDDKGPTVLIKDNTHCRARRKGARRSVEEAARKRRGKNATRWRARRDSRGASGANRAAQGTRTTVVLGWTVSRARISRGGATYLCDVQIEMRSHRAAESRQCGEKIETCASSVCKWPLYAK